MTIGPLGNPIPIGVIEFTTPVGLLMKANPNLTGPISNRGLSRHILYRIGFIALFNFVSENSGGLQCQAFPAVIKIRKKL
jgi:hypothetical protein